ncbi:hypothetical protein [Flammeovirga agarivorans]|uniref:Uncharacterized protein n=1 Tax=Flammeovirga agarivorans TaxID=2726742 RepID=A0A7X8SQ29_9BACT|nr:hypothetical protein [Flammeovirga agarivorans]NLR94314.1 hypothetical protein [Flammeovirga agarivorans]
MKYLLLVFQIIFSFSLFAQESLEEVHINTTFKGNECYKSLAETLLGELKAKNIHAFLPLNKTKPTSFRSLSYQLRGWGNVNSNPQKSICDPYAEINDMAYLFNQDYILLYDDSNKMLDKTIEPIYIQFIIAPEYSQTGLEVYGPVFSYQEIKETKIKLKDTDLFISDLITNRRFQGYKIDDKGNTIPMWTH